MFTCNKKIKFKHTVFYNGYIMYLEEYENFCIKQIHNNINTIWVEIKFDDCFFIIYKDYVNKYIFYKNPILQPNLEFKQELGEEKIPFIAKEINTMPEIYLEIKLQEPYENEIDTIKIANLGIIVGDKIYKRDYR